VLSQAEIDSFTADGYVAVRGAVPADVLRRCQDEIWSALGEHGVRRDDPSTWREPVVRIGCPESEAFAAAGSQPVLWEAFDQLIGEGRRWQLRGGRGLVGQLPVPGARATGAVPVQRRGRRQRADPGPARLAPGRHPRIMAQPGVALHDAFPLVPPLSPVELAMSPERAA